MYTCFSLCIYGCLLSYTWLCVSVGCSFHFAFSYTEVLFVSAALSEVSSKDQRVGMSLRHLSKKFGDHEVVKDINCDFYEGQVTVLLGHNGAAKSTTL